jgi:hypothetical protein
VPNVEFAPFVKEGPIDVQLHYKSFFGSVVMLALALHNCIQLVHLIDNSDPISSVGQLPRLYYPYVAHRTTNRNAVLFVPLLLTNDGLTFLVVSDESFVLRVFGSFFDVKGERNHFEKLPIGELIVLFEVIEESLFVAEVEVVGKMVVHLLTFILMLRQLQNLLTLP